MFWSVELDLFCLECNEVSSSEFWGFYGSSMTFGSSILMIRVVFLLCWRIIVVCLSLDLVDSWMKLGFSVGVETLGALLSINVPWSLEFSDILKFWS